MWFQRKKIHTLPTEANWKYFQWGGGLKDQNLPSVGEYGYFPEETHYQSGPNGEKTVTGVIKGFKKIKINSRQLRFLTSNVFEIYRSEYTY